MKKIPAKLFSFRFTAVFHHFYGFFLVTSTKKSLTDVFGEVLRYLNPCTGKSKSGFYTRIIIYYIFHHGATKPHFFGNQTIRTKFVTNHIIVLYECESTFKTNLTTKDQFSVYVVYAWPSKTDWPCHHANGLHN